MTQGQEGPLGAAGAKALLSLRSDLEALTVKVARLEGVAEASQARLDQARAQLRGLGFDPDNIEAELTRRQLILEGDLKMLQGDVATLQAKANGGGG